jgi:hypothetical protein
MAFFYTYFDQSYLCRGFALSKSLQQYRPEDVLFILCLDEKTFQVLSAFPSPSRRLIRLADLEKDDPELGECRKNRSLIEYYFTLSPGFGHYLMKTYPEIDFLTYLDGDTYFFSSPTLILEDYKNSSIGVTPHRFPARRQQRAVFGQFNVGWVSFRRDEQGLACLAEWRQDCIKWCYDRWDGARFGDQKYLDLWPLKYDQLRVIDHPGVNAAPWNLEDAMITFSEGDIFINGAPLVLYHFHGLSRVHASLYQLGLASYQVCPTPLIVQQIYMPYLRALYEVAQEVDAHLGEVFFSPGIFIKKQRYVKRKEGFKGWLEPLLGCYKGVVGQDYCWISNKALKGKK